MVGPWANCRGRSAASTQDVQFRERRSSSEGEQIFSRRSKDRALEDGESEFEGRLTYGVPSGARRRPRPGVEIPVGFRAQDTQIRRRAHLTLSGLAHPIRLALRPLLPRVVVPLEGRSSGSRIIRCCTPSQPRMRPVASTQVSCGRLLADGLGSGEIFMVDLIIRITGYQPISFGLSSACSVPS